MLLGTKVKLKMSIDQISILNVHNITTGASMAFLHHDLFAATNSHWSSFMCRTDLLSFLLRPAFWL